ncbi:MAG: hypothetical protein HS120_07295 [Burkholderiales bacterium]|nr:hypothetical protein [Burkholderiales bacterium]
MTDYKTIAESNNFIVLDKYTQEWKVAESYQGESDLERELIQNLVNQGYEYLPELNTPAGLPREIELRQKQYEYYRDLLLSFPQFPSPGGVPEGRGGKKAGEL